MNRHSPAVKLGVVFHDGQAKPCPLFLGCVVRLKHLFNLVARNSRAIVFDRDLEGVIPLVTRLDVDFAIPDQRFSCIL